MVALLLFTPGCWDRRELEDQAFVQTIGIDKAKNQQLAVTFRIAVPSKTGLGQTGGGGGGSEGSAAQKASLLTTVIAPTVPAAMTLTAAYVNRELNLMHIKAFIFGESFARQGVGRVLNFISRYREMRRNIIVGVAKGDAQSLIADNAPDLEKSYTKYWEGVRLLESRLALHPGSLFHDFMASIETAEKAGTMIYLAKNEKSMEKDPDKLDIPPSFKEGDLAVKAGDVPRVSGNPIEYLGTAVFNGDKFVDTLNYMETQVFLILDGTYQMSTMNIQEPKNKEAFLSLEVKQGAPPRISVDISGDTLTIREKLSLEGDLMAVPGTEEDYSSNITNQQILEEAFIEHLKEITLAMLKKMQKNGTDIVGYGEYAQRNFLTRQQWTDFKWSEKFKDAEFELDFEFHLRRTGLQGRNPMTR